MVLETKAFTVLLKLIQRVASVHYVVLLMVVLDPTTIHAEYGSGTGKLVLL